MFPSKNSTGVFGTCCGQNRKDKSKDLTFQQNLNSSVNQTVINSKHSIFIESNAFEKNRCSGFMYLCRTQLPAVLQAGQSCQCRCKASRPLREQSPSFWMQETCMLLREAVVLFFL